MDNRLSISGQFCSSPPDELPFPVKLLIIIDQSASLQCTDPGNNRLTALAQLGAELDPMPNVWFGVVGFASWSKVVPFTPDWNVASAALAPEDGQGGPATDYQGALSTALTVLEQDMVEAGAAEVARTKYVLLFLSDGVPEPRCRAGCDDGDSPPDSLYGVCNTTQDIPDDVYVDMTSGCPDYNQEHQILQKVQDIVALSETYGAGELTLNTLFLFAPEEEIAQVCGDVSQFGYLREEAEPLMRDMAEAGGGTYRDVNISTELDFLTFNYESLESPYVLRQLFAINLSAWPQPGGAALDSDMDGLEDSLEFDAGLDRLDADSDGDGYGDALEHFQSLHGFDPLDPELPASPCDDATDRDGDGLAACEESWLELDPLLPDTDGDRLPDGLEVKLELDPTLPDAQVDHDFDGRLSGEELRTGTHPRLPDTEVALVNQIRYTVQALPRGEDGTTCYDFLAQGLTLVPALSTSTQKGLNRLLVVAEEEPEELTGSRGRYHVSCLQARYLGETFKDPPSGQISGLSSARFVEMPLFDADQHCLAVGADPSLAREVP